MKANQAEEKSLKFEETSACGDGGNLERSLNPKERVETIIGNCLKCEKPLTSKRKYCSKKCQGAYLQQKYRIRHSLIQKPGVGSGGNQFDDKNHQFKNGWTTYRRKAFDNLPNLCNRCRSTKFLLVHHKDHNRMNSDLENLEVLCKKCHQEHHALRDDKGQYTSPNNKE